MLGFLSGAERCLVRNTRSPTNALQCQSGLRFLGLNVRETRDRLAHIRILAGVFELLVIVVTIVAFRVPTWLTACRDGPR